MLLVREPPDVSPTIPTIFAARIDWRNSACPRSRRNPAGGRPEGQKAAVLAEPSATRRSRRAPEPTETANAKVLR